MVTGRNLVLEDVGSIAAREYDVPDPPAGGLVLEMIRANVCGSDVHILNGGHPLVGPGCVMGHEGIGRVHALGEGVTADFAGEPLSVGDRVVSTYFQACRRCPECNNGHPNICRNAYTGWSKQADESPHFHGTFGTHYVVGPSFAVYKVPDGVTSKAASSVNCALSQVFYGCLVGEVSYDDKVVILGAGGLGVCASAVASSFGATVWVAEMAPQRLEKVKEFGAHHTVDLTPADGSDGRVDLVKDLTDGGADVVIDLTGVPSAFSEGVRMTRAGGIFVEIGNITPHKYTDFDPGLFTRTGVQIRAAIRYPQNVLGRAIRFVADTPHFPWESLVDKDFTLDEVEEALAQAAARKVTRAGIVISD
ncbi:zinc-binding dehydrogenase [Brevibacterium yomogidense]|uniref:Alcohol dehydrogenase n=1 Tax=Brevibacterium yomogidense TaxID=946573 RepID=A0A1X6WVL4_9MICO|nr:zinc-binding dehydrogenase [Brevibacterium yomogidense]SLM89471.1 Alcohol dehydrogenase [Brevibacterium yomogidense]